MASSRGGAGRPYCLEEKEQGGGQMRSDARLEGWVGVGTVTTHGAEGRSHCGLACVGQKGGVASASAMPVWGRGAPLSRRWDLALLGVISSRIDKRLRSLDPGEVWVIPMG